MSKGHSKKTAVTDMSMHASAHKTDLKKIRFRKLRRNLKPVVVMTEPEPKQPGRPSLRMVVYGAAAVAVFGLAFILISGRDDQKQSPQQKQADKHSQALKSAAKANNAKDYGEEAQGLKDYIATDPPAQYASKASLRLATAYINAKDYGNAIASLEEAKAKYTDKETNFAIIRGLGLAYMMRGDDKQNKDDYRKALEYYNQALKIEKADPNLQHVAGSDENNVRYLEEQLK